MRKFEGAIERAKEACKNSGQKIEDHFAHAAKMVEIGSDAKRELEDYHLSHADNQGFGRDDARGIVGNG